MPIMMITNHGIRDIFEICPNCGKEIRGRTSAYCPYCGKKLEEEE